MRALTLVSLWLALYVTSSLGAVSVGHDNWGMKVYISDAPRECAPFYVYYDINRNGDPPKNLELPADAAVTFLTPDSALDEWMVLRPPMGKGMLSWTCTLRAGKQFVVRNRNGYKQVFTVGAGSSGTQCGQNAPTVTTSSSYGSINAQVYKSLTANNYAPTSISPPNQFSGVNMPSTAGLSVVNVPLGAAVPNPPANETPGKNPDNVVPDDDDDTTTTPDERSTTSAPGATDDVSRTGTSERGQATVDPGDIPNDPDSGDDGHHSNSSPGETPGAASPGSQGSSTNIGAIVGGIIAALVLGALLGALFVCLARRRRRQKRLIEVTPMTVAPAPESPSVAPTHYLDRKYPIPIPTVPTAGSSVSGYETWDGYGTSVGTMDIRRPLSGLSEEPPQYSRFG